MGVLSFDDLTDTEAACVRAVYGRRRYEPDPCCTRVLGDEPHAEDWGPDRTVRAAVLCQLLMGEGPVPPESGESPLVLRVVRLGGVRIVGRIDLEAVKVPFPLELTGCWLDDATALLLQAADLAVLRLVGCWLPAGLHADQIRTRGDVIFSRCCFLGEVRLLGAHIGGALVLTGAKLRNKDGNALTAGGMQVDGGVFGQEGFEVDGEVRLLGAHIGGVLDLTGAKLRNKDGNALTADGMQVEGGVFGLKGFEVDGEVRLPAAHIGGQLDLTGAKLRNKDGDALRAGRLHVDDSLIWHPATVLGCIDFRFARVGIWADTKAAMYFPAALEGLQYDAIYQEPASLAVSARLEWLALDPYGHSPLPYVQLASVLRAGGNDRQAHKVLIASQQVRRAQGRNWLTRTSRQSLSAALRWTVGYGYRPWLALIWLLALIGTASLMIQLLPGGAAKPFTPMTGAPEPFIAPLYVLDTMLPFVDFGYSRWVPNGAAQLITATFIVLGWTRPPCPPSLGSCTAATDRDRAESRTPTPAKDRAARNHSIAADQSQPTLGANVCTAARQTPAR